MTVNPWKVVRDHPEPFGPVAQVVEHVKMFLNPLFPFVFLSSKDPKAEKTKNF